MFHVQLTIVYGRSNIKPDVLPVTVVRFAVGYESVYVFETVKNCTNKIVSPAKSDKQLNI